VLWEQTALARRARGFDVVYGIGNFALLAAQTRQVVAFQNPTHFGDLRDSSTAGQPPGAPVATPIEAWLAHVSLRPRRCERRHLEKLRAAMMEDVPSVTPWLVASAPPDDGPFAHPAVEAPQAELPREYVLSVANDYPHKDWDRLIRASGAPKTCRRSCWWGSPGPPAVSPRRPNRPCPVVPPSHRLARRPIERVLHPVFASEGCRGPLSARGVPLTSSGVLLGLPLAASDIPSHREYARSAGVDQAPSRSGRSSWRAPRIPRDGWNVARRKR